MSPSLLTTTDSLTVLEKLISNLKKSGGLEAFRITRKYYSGEKLDMLPRTHGLDPLHYFTANNLYGLAMVQKLPCGNYQWCDVNDF